MLDSESNKGGEGSIVLQDGALNLHSLWSNTIKKAKMEEKRRRKNAVTKMMITLISLNGIRRLFSILESKPRTPEVEVSGC